MHKANPDRSRLDEKASDDQGETETETGDVNHTYPELDQQVHELLKRLKYFQDRAHHLNPVKAAAKRRLTFGHREIRQLARLRDTPLKLIIVARDLDCFDDTTLSELRALQDEVESLCQPKVIPIIRASTRKKLGKILKTNGRIGAVGIKSYAGAEEIYKKLIDMWQQDPVPDAHHT